jgi:SAM-dependent methyltransferase
VVCGDIAEVTLVKPQSVDVAVMIEVLEHVVDPRRTIRAVHKVTRPGGMLWITVPNYGGVSRRVARSRWREYNMPSHLTFFSARTLPSFLAANGFAPLSVGTSGINVVDLMDALRLGWRGEEPQGAAPVGSRATDAVSHRARVDQCRARVARHARTKELLNRALGLGRLGDSLTCLAARVP